MQESRQVPVVELLDLTKTFRDFWGRSRVRAVNQLTLEIRKGEVFGLLGPNGSGKSTSIKMILGLLFPTAGAIRVFGRSPRDVRVKNLIGYMPEESTLYRFLNAEETLDFYGRLFDYTAKERAYRTDSLLDLVGLSRERKRPLSEYSKGMSRRIGLAQALVNDPELVILDEPTTGLDPIGTSEVKELIIDLKSRGKTVLLSSHLLADVEDVCDRIAILYGGRLIAKGKVGELLAKSEITQISLENVRPEVKDRIVDLIKREAGISEAKVDNPHQKLEEFFLNVVEQAREKQMETSGAAPGRAASEVRVASEEKEARKRREQLIKSLINKKPEEKSTALKAVSVDDGRKKKQEVLAELTAAESRTLSEKRKEAEEKAAKEVESERQRKEAQKSVLDKLTGKEKPDKPNE